MRKIFILFAGFMVIVVSALAQTPQTYGVFRPVSIAETSIADTMWQSEAWYTPEGRLRLDRAEAKEDFYQLAHHFQPQINPLYCGIASSVIVLNALRQGGGEIPSQSVLETRKPEAWGGGVVPFPSYSQQTLLNAQTDKAVKPKEVISLTNVTPENTHDAAAFDPGLTLEQLALLMRTYGLEVVVTHAELEQEKGIAGFRQMLKGRLADSVSFVVVNFKGDEAGSPTGGHISPLAAYDAVSDSVLVLDVAGHKNPWYWLPVSLLYRAMHTRDGQQYRGWLEISEGH